MNGFKILDLIDFGSIRLEIMVSAGLTQRMIRFEGSMGRVSLSVNRTTTRGAAISRMS